MSIKITICYKEKPDDIWNSIPIESREYFDAEPGETLSIDSAPRFDHALDYIGKSRAVLHKTEITITETDPSAATRTITEIYWRDGGSSLTQVHDSRDGRSEYIFRAIMTDSVVEIVRFACSGSDINLLFDVLVETTKSGHQLETKLFPKAEPKASG